MLELTVGQVSGLVAVGIFVVRLCIPLSITFILAGLLQDDNTALSWSVAGHVLQTSQWPSFLRLESTTSRSVRKDIVCLTQLSKVMFVIITAASILTPIGLYEEMTAGDEVEMEFQYVKDTSPTGYGTPPRLHLGFNRACGSDIPLPCPGLDTPFSVQDLPNGTTRVDFPFGYDLNVPQSLIDLYSSGTGSPGSTISNMFNIDWRTYYTASSAKINNGSRYLVGSFRQLQTMVLNDAIEPIEGLLVDTRSAQVGLRNHTLPVALRHGAEWTEDLLFFQPETECVNHNVTIDFRINSATDNSEFQPSSLSREVDRLVLTDRGGFVDTIRTYPRYNRSDLQRNPELKGRAYKAAFMSNYYTMSYFNVTNLQLSYVNSENGKTFPLNHDSWNVDYFFDAMTTSTDWGGFLGLSDPLSNISSGHKGPPNPFEINSFNFSLINLLCDGAGGEDLANITNVAVSCGMVYGAPRRSDGSTTLIFDEGSEWTIPLYSCATAVKATIKTVDFRVNSTLGLGGLTVTKIEDKKYNKDEEKPIWGVENAGLTLVEARPLWGIISAEMRAAPNISSVRKESLYLPGYSYGGIGDGPVWTSQNLPGVSFGSDAMDFIYSMGPGSSKDYLRDYTGRSNMAMYAKWQALSSSANTTGKIIDLIWTDVAASAIVGNKGRMGSGQTGSTTAETPIRVRVRPIVRQIKINYSYAVPSFITLALWVIITIAVLVFRFLGKANMTTLRRQLNRSSPGRILTAVLLKNESALVMKAKDWSSTLGQAKIGFGDSCPMVCVDDTASNTVDDAEAPAKSETDDQPAQVVTTLGSSK